jgi:signal transduction histidine kinase
MGRKKRNHWIITSGSPRGARKTRDFKHLLEISFFSPHVKKEGKPLQKTGEEPLIVTKITTDQLVLLYQELKTPLVPIIGWIELIKDSLEKGKNLYEIVRYLEALSIYHAAMRLNTYIDNFLNLNAKEVDQS